MHFRILKMIATNDFLTAVGCTKFVFGQGSTWTWRSLPCSPDPLAGFRGLASKERKGRVFI